MNKNPDINLAGIIHTAPFFKFCKPSQFDWFQETKVKLLRTLGEWVLGNPKLDGHWMTHNKDYWARLIPLN